jgi:outer membrane immunogenic protein
MKKLATYVVASAALLATPAIAADIAVKAPPPAPAPVPTWTGFYGGIQFGGGWSDEAVNYSPNDPASLALFVGNVQPFPSGYRISQTGAVGGVEAGYNWEWSNWLLGVEADFSAAGMSGRASGTSLAAAAPVGSVGFLNQTSTAEQSMDWYGTVRGRAGWLATPNLLLFGTGGFAYGRVAGSANHIFTGINVIPVVIAVPPFGFGPCPLATTCFAGSSSQTRTGWTAGAGLEYLLDQHWSAKIEYQFVDLGIENVRIIAANGNGFTPASFNAAFNDRFNVVRVGLNYQFH